jgi:prepilin-type processing-associated H-X9-DG protein
MIDYACPHCGLMLQIPDEYAGQPGTCRRCGNTITPPGTPGAPVYAGAQGPAAPPMPTTDGLAIASLVLGVLAFVCLGPVFSIPGVILGHMARSRIRQSGGRIGGGGMAMAGLVLGYSNILLVLVVAVLMLAAMFLPAVSRANEASDRARCQNNLKQFGLVLKMYANESKGQAFPPLSKEPGRLMFDPQEVYPEYVTDPVIMLCPKMAKDQGQAEKPDPMALIDDASYFYLGYAVRSDADVQLYAQAYRERMANGQGMNEDISISDGKTLYRLREGVERFFIEDIANPAAGAMIQSSIPVVIERLGHHVPEGCNILYMDGHVEFKRYPGEWPMTEATMNALESLDQMR